MEENLEYCGLVCEKCAIYLATREPDEEKRYQMRVDIAKEIKKYYNQEIKPEDINDCDGCKAETGRIFSGDCKIRKCVIDKEIENCAYCNDYPCEQLEKLFTTDKEAKKRLDTIRSKL